MDKTKILDNEEIKKLGVNDLFKLLEENSTTMSKELKIMVARKEFNRAIESVIVRASKISEAMKLDPLDIMPTLVEDLRNMVTAMDETNKKYKKAFDKSTPLIKRKSTMVELVDECLKLPQTDEMKVFVAEAAAGEFHDFKNNKYDCGKVESYNRLMAMGHTDLANQIKNGDYDEEADLDDKKIMKENALAGGFSEAQCFELFGL